METQNLSSDSKDTLDDWDDILQKLNLLSNNQLRDILSTNNLDTEALNDELHTRVKDF